MTIVHFAEMLRDSINEKINECRNDIHESHNPIYNDSLLIEIQALEWVQGQISDLVNKERKEYRISNKE
jgi:malate synthase